MKRNLKFLALALLFSAASCSFTTKRFDDPDKDKLLIDLITHLLERGHFDAKDINDAFSEAVFTDYIEALDPLKRYFYEKDIEEFSQYRTLIDDMIKEKDLTFFDLTYNRFKERFEEARALQEKILEKPFDFEKDETIDTDYENLAFVKTKKQLKERWRKQVKLNVLGTYFDNKEEAQNKLDSGEEDFVMKSDAEFEEEAREDTAEWMSEFFELTAEQEREDYFAVFLNAIVEEFDPHTAYYAPVARERFDMQMSGQFQGIGARLQKKNGQIIVSEVISGGPAWRQEELQEGDIILKVKQENEEEAVSIVGMRLSDAVKLIKGPKGTDVTLNVKRKIDGLNGDVTITRDVVELEEVYAKTASVKKDDNRYGVINLPKFYFDMRNYKQRNAATDIKKEIERLKEEGLDGLVIDLRNNGGGSLQSVVDMAGLFIKKGPIVQIKSNGDQPEVLSDEDESVIWDGPLVILVNEISASASEILAAAMQDYKRAIIIGSKQTYGKGTVQRVVPLSNYLRNDDYGDIGALKLTIQKFYRVNGGSTQLEGVKSDVVVPDRYSYIDIGEKDQDNPLPWDKIRPASYETWDGYIDFEKTIASSKERMSKSGQLQLIDDYAQWLKNRRDESTWSLNYEAYKSRIKKGEEDAKRFDAMDEYTSNLAFESLPYEVKLFEQDTVLKEKRTRWHKNLAKDVYVEEALNVLEDLKINNIRRSKVASIKD